MSLLIDKGDIANISAATSQILKDTIGQVAAVLVPAIAEAAKDTLGGVTVTVGPIVIEPITIRMETK